MQIGNAFWPNERQAQPKTDFSRISRLLLAERIHACRRGVSVGMFSPDPGGVRWTVSFWPSISASSTASIFGDVDENQRIGSTRPPHRVTQLLKKVPMTSASSEEVQKDLTALHGEQTIGLSEWAGRAFYANTFAISTTFSAPCLLMSCLTPITSSREPSRFRP